MTALPDITDMLLEQRQSTLIATINRPAVKNALNGPIVEGLMGLCDWLQDNRDVRALVLRGADGCFSAGGDIKEFGAMLMQPEPKAGEKDPIAKSNRVFGDLLLKLDALPQTVIAVVEGPAFGGANGFIAIADIVVAEAGAKFSLSETTLGLPPAQIGPFVVRKTGLFTARRLALTGARFGAEEALAIGLVDEVHAGSGALEAALTAHLSAIGRCEPHANAATKSIFNRAGGEISPSELDDAADVFAICLRGKGKEGAMAFAAKKQPEWVEAYGERQDA